MAPLSQNHQHPPAQTKQKRSGGHIQAKRFGISFLISFVLVSGIYWLNWDRLSDWVVLMLTGRNVSSIEEERSQIALQEPPELPTEEEYLKETYFIGDSRTNGLAGYDFIPTNRVFAEDGLSHETALTKAFVKLPDGNTYTLAQAVAKTQPKRMIVAFGINGIAYLSESEFMRAYGELIDQLKEASPDSILIIQAILPVSESFAMDTRYSNTKIDQYNQELKDLADEKDVYFLDPSSVLKGSNNALNPLYDSGDGLHFGRAAYSALLNYFCTHMIVE